MAKIVYAFDVDETLEISNGPVKLQAMMDLRIQGHIVGLCGNWGHFCRTLTGWQHLISFMNIGCEKAPFLYGLKAYAAADDYVMVGNVFGEKNKLGFVCGSHDSVAAAQAGWRFIKEDAFSEGAR